MSHLNYLICYIHNNYKYFSDWFLTTVTNGSYHNLNHERITSKLHMQCTGNEIK